MRSETSARQALGVAQQILSAPARSTHRQIATAAYATARLSRPRPSVYLQANWSILPPWIQESQGFSCREHGLSRCPAFSRCYGQPALKQHTDDTHDEPPPAEGRSGESFGEADGSALDPTDVLVLQAPRNASGVQLLSPSLQEQLFPPKSCSHLPQLDPLALSISQEHLSNHGLRPSQASVLPEISFKLPALLSEEAGKGKSRAADGRQMSGKEAPPRPAGPNLAEHFWVMGRQAAQPWLGMAHLLADMKMPGIMPEGVQAEHSNVEQSNATDEAHGIAAQDWLALEPSCRHEHDLRLPKWVRKSGWTRYPIHRSEDNPSVMALGEGEPVPYPPASDGPMVFDVETMPKISHFGVMATALSETAWYSWISPWLLGENDSPDHLIPFGASRKTVSAQEKDAGEDKVARLVVGHNVGFDRARILDEYNIERTSIRWLDTMSLHVATRGISSPQRSAWQAHRVRKRLREDAEQLDQQPGSLAREQMRHLLKSLGMPEEMLEEEHLENIDFEQLLKDSGQDLAPEQKEQMEEQWDDSRQELAAAAMQDVAQYQADISLPEVSNGNGNGDNSALWQDITSKNSLADVAELHCDIKMDKGRRNIFVDATSREEILQDLESLLEYCATDVAVTHKVFSKVWPVFAKENCRHPVTMAGVFELGSTFLPIDQEWNQYIERSEAMYQQASEEVRRRLIELTENLKEEGTKDLRWSDAEAIATRRGATLESVEEYLKSGGTTAYPYHYTSASSSPKTEGPRAWWEDDPWFSQLDWSPKKPKKIKAETTDSIGVDEVEPGHQLVPAWYRDLVTKAPPSGLSFRSPIGWALAQLQLEGQTLFRDQEGKWSTGLHGPIKEMAKTQSPFTATFLKTKLGKTITSANTTGEKLLVAIRTGQADEAKELLGVLAEDALSAGDESPVHLSALDWSKVQVKDESQDTVSIAADQPWWPKWYWDIFKSANGELDVTIRSKIAPILLKVSWRGRPLFHSREHGWIYRVDAENGSKEDFVTRQRAVEFTKAADAALKLQTGPQEHVINERGKPTKELQYDPLRPTFFKVPHSAGDESNVGSPFAKSFIPFFEDSTLRSEHPSASGMEAAKAALDLNAQCSYWISARDRVERQMVVWEGQNEAIADGDSTAPGNKKLGIILPQLITMGTVTRRAIEKTWLTASNAKKNRVGSELKSMVKAPPGWSIVGADVDSEELWICSVMGDAQFGMHGATAVGWMTLEGTKAEGTDLHSKTASILGTSRNQAKVFNYSRIYGAGIRHTMQLLLKANPAMPTEEAMRLAKDLYASTKGQNTHKNDYFGTKFWYGGSESYVFNKLESIAISEVPRTPALDCGVTAALTRKFLPTKSGGGNQDYMPSRINWVVQSSGVDYLHMLIAAMHHLCTTYDINARFMISVHDEVRYLSKEEDRYRTALALQIANLWTRAMFAYRLELDSLPQGCAFFSQVDIDRILRKEVDDACITPSSPNPVPPGEALAIEDLLDKTNGGSLGKTTEGSHSASIAYKQDLTMSSDVPEYEYTHQAHRSSGARGLFFLQAQATNDINEIRSLDRRARVMEEEINGGVRRVQGKKTTFNGRSNFARKSGAFAQARAYSTMPANTPSSAELVSLFPKRLKSSRKPFFDKLQHKRSVKGLYRDLLRQCPSYAPTLRHWIRRMARISRGQTSAATTAGKLSAAEGVRTIVLDCCEAY